MSKPKPYRADFDGFYEYVCELVATYRVTKSLKGISELAKKHGVRAMTKENFFHFGLDGRDEDMQMFFDKSGKPDRAIVDAIRKDLADIDKKRNRERSEEIKQLRQQKESVFGESMPGGYNGFIQLQPTKEMPYRWALSTQPAIDNAAEYMASREVSKLGTAAELQKQLKLEYVAEYLEYTLPTLCCPEELKEYTIGFVKDTNNGDSYWLSTDKDILRLLAWIAYIV